jgi:hypothetical protein
MIGPKSPLKPKHVWAIRHHLKAASRVRDLALSMPSFGVAIS